MPSALEIAIYAVDQLPLRYFERRVTVEIAYVVTTAGYAVQILEGGN